MEADNRKQRSRTFLSRHCMGLNSGIDPEIPGTQTAKPDQQFLQKWSWKQFQVFRCMNA